MAKKNNVKKKKKQGLSMYGPWVFGLGLLVILITAFLDMSQTVKKVVLVVLMILGLIVGILNVTEKETNSFLIAALSVVLTTSIFVNLLKTVFLNANTGVVWSGMGVVENLFTGIIIFIVPAILVVAFRVLFLTAKDE